MHENAHNAMLKSALTTEGALHTLQEIIAWIDQRKLSTPAEVVAIPWADMKGWAFHRETGNIEHESGRFFTVEGIRVRTNWGVVPEWQQPIICQPEVGILGIICKEINNTLHFLLQAKIEPGNIGFVQIAPTLQATRSNYTQVHKGTKPKFLDQFLSVKPHKVHLDVLQSEQGSKYLKKRNRNIIVEVEEPLPEDEDYCWMTLGQIAQLLQINNLINMDTRTVISCVSFGSFDSRTLDLLQSVLFRDASNSFDPRFMLLSALDGERHLNSMAELISWITRLKSIYELTVDRIPLNRTQSWVRTEDRISHESGKYFSVMAVMAIIPNREVSSWCQPLVQSAQTGIIAFLIRRIHGVYHFLVQAKLEAGNLDIIELAPTVQCINDNYRHSLQEQKPAYLDYILGVDPSQIWSDTEQSEEGGRFFHERNRCLLVEVENEFPIEVPENYAWMTLNQMKSFIHFNNYFNMEARSLISAIRLR